MILKHKEETMPQHDESIDSLENKLILTDIPSLSGVLDQFKQVTQAAIEAKRRHNQFESCSFYYSNYKAKNQFYLNMLDILNSHSSCLDKMDEIEKALSAIPTNSDWGACYLEKNLWTSKGEFPEAIQFAWATSEVAQTTLLAP